MSTNPTLDERLSHMESLIIQSGIAQKRVLTLKEAATYSGRSISNLYKLTSTGAIPHSKPEGKVVYFDRLELEEWLLRNPVKTVAKIEMEAATRVALGGRKERVK